MSELQTITLGGGCFWCTEAVYVKVRGVVDVESGYSNGQTARPSYEEVCTGRTGCNEVVKLSEACQDKTFGKPIVTEVLPLANYWPAESYHQDYFENNPNQGYCAFVVGPKVDKFRKTFAARVKE